MRGAWLARVLAPWMLVSSLVASTARADPERFALVIGGNRGFADEAPLRFAEQDATRFAGVLVHLGGVPEENLLVALAPSAGRVRALAAEIGARVARLRTAQPSAKPVLFVYYSGHSSATALHLGGQDLLFAELRAAIQEAGADATVYIVDSCRSGGMTRARGGRHALGFEIQTESAPPARGTAILASAAEDEDAQESDRLAGGVFTTHVIGGLRGAADGDGDHRVTLSEVYAYAYRETLQSTSRTRALQHPTFAIALTGGQDVTVSRTDRVQGQAVLRVRDSGRYTLHDRWPTERFAGEFELARPADLLVPPGRYTVRHVGARVVHETTLDLAEGDAAPVAVAQMRALPYGASVRRGLTQESMLSLQVDLGAAMPPLTGGNVGVQSALGVAADFAGARVQGRLRHVWSESANSDVTMSQHLFGIDVAALHLFELAALDGGFGMGTRIGLDRFAQSFASQGLAPARAMWAWRVAPLVRFEFAPAARWLSAIECGVDIHAVRVEAPEGLVWRAPVAPFCTVSGGLYIP